MKKTRLLFPRLTFKGRATTIKKGDTMHINLKHGLLSFNRNGTDLKFRGDSRILDDNKVLLGKCSPVGIAKLVECIVGIRALPLRNTSTHEGMHFVFGKEKR